MENKIVLKLGRYAQIWIAVFASILIGIMFLIFIILAAVDNDTETLIQMILAIGICWTVVWLVFLLVIISKKSLLEVNEKGIIKRTKKKVIWEIDWSEIDEMSYYKFNLLRVLLLHFGEGDLIITYNKAVIQPKPFFSIPNDGRPTVGVSIFPRDAQRIKKVFGKDISFH